MLQRVEGFLVHRLKRTIKDIQTTMTWLVLLKWGLSSLDLRVGQRTMWTCVRKKVMGYKKSDGYRQPVSPSVSKAVTVAEGAVI